jgi:hypothetical protein
LKMLAAHLSAPMAITQKQPAAASGSGRWQRGRWRAGRPRLDGTIALECSTCVRPLAGGGHAATTDGVQVVGSSAWRAERGGREADKWALFKFNNSFENQSAVN